LQIVAKLQSDINHNRSTENLEKYRIRLTTLQASYNEYYSKYETSSHKRAYSLLLWEFSAKITETRMQLATLEQELIRKNLEKMVADIPSKKTVVDLQDCKSEANALKQVYGYYYNNYYCGATEQDHIISHIKFLHDFDAGIKNIDQQIVESESKLSGSVIQVNG
jgi:hypothetical protein